ncbi:hypothetical protein Agub_g3184 [Astrephomene gubernaculifera]|uniref:Uncharacterized protein n=1 Tax=Astrephomene gubernaculifera TaxID=47775 RepID=A0AAD3DLY1_9CHLO|nr:hypothetical protein Agub_g3184 [Astrephomene gubernaculifera]
MTSRPHDPRAKGIGPSTSWHASSPPTPIWVPTQGCASSSALSPLTSNGTVKQGTRAPFTPSATALSYTSSPLRPNTRTSPSTIPTVCNSAQLQRPSGAPSTGYNSDMRTIHNLSKADSCRKVIRLLQERSGAAAVAFVNPAALQALARCMVLTASGAAEQPGQQQQQQQQQKRAAAAERLRGDELQDVQDTVDRLLSELHGRTAVLSFPQLVDVLSALVVLLPALRWKPRDPRVITDIAARLPAAAAASNSLTMIPLCEVCKGFLSLAQLMYNPSMRADFGRVPELGTQAGAFLRSEVFEGVNVSKRMKDADLETMAMAVELSMAYKTPASASFVDSMTYRVKGVLADITTAAEEAATKAVAAAEVKGQQRKPGQPAAGGADKDSSTGSSARDEQAAADAHDDGSRRDSADRDRSTARRDSSSPSSRNTSTTFGSTMATLDAKGGLDAPSLARLLEAWCRCKPNQAHSPNQTWLTQMAAVVLRSQDPAASSRRQELRTALQEVVSRLPRLRRDMQAAEARLQTAKRKRRAAAAAAAAEAREAGGSSGRGGGRAGARGRGARGGGRGRSGAVTSEAKDEGSDRAKKKGASGPPGQAHDRSQCGHDKEEKEEVAVDDVESAEAASERAKAALAEAEAQLAAVRAGLADLGVAAVAVRQLEDGRLVSLLAAVRERMGESSGKEVCEAAEKVLAARLEKMHPLLLARTLSLLVGMGHSPERELITSALRVLQPHLSTLPSSDATSLLVALHKARYVPPLSGRISREDMVGRIARYKGDFPGADWLAVLLRTCADWGVPYPPDLFRDLENEVQERVLGSLPLSAMGDCVSSVTKARKQSGAFRTFNTEGGERIRSSLLEGWVLPLARLRQPLRCEDLFFMALGDFMATRHTTSTAGPAQGPQTGPQRLDERRAALLLDCFAANAAQAAGPAAAAGSQSWPLTTGQRQALEELLAAVLTQPPGSPGERAPLLLAAGRALRVIACKMSWGPNDPFLGAHPPDGRRPSSLLLPAVEGLMRLNPSAEHLASAAQALFVELQWKEPQTQTQTQQPQAEATQTQPQPTASPSTQQQRSSGSNKRTKQQQQGQQQQEALPLLVRMLDAAAPTLSGCRPESYAYLLAACCAAGHQPPLPWLASLYRAAAAELSSRSAAREGEGDDSGAASAAAAAGGGGGGVTAEALGLLLNALTEMERAMGERAERAQRDTAAGGYAAARAALLQAMATAMLRDPALRVLAAQPDTFTLAVRQLAVLGLRPPTGWLPQYLAAVQGLMTSMSLTGLAYTAEGLALLHAAPPNVFIDILLTQVGTRNAVGAADPFLRGLLLGGVHALWHASAARERERGLPLSKAARETWAGVHVAFVADTRQGNALPRYSPSQLVLVVAAVVAYELSRSPAAATPAAATSTTTTGGSSSARGGGGGGAAGAGADIGSGLAFTGKVEGEWLEDCCMSLLSGRSSSGAAFPPPPSLLIDLLRLASRVLRGSADGSIVRLAPAAAEEPEGDDADTAGGGGGGGFSNSTAGLVVRYVRLSLLDIAHAAKRRAADMPSRAEWDALLRAAMAARIDPAAPVLEVYTSSLVQAGIERARGAVQTLATAAAAAAAADAKAKAKEKEKEKGRRIHVDSAGVVHEAAPVPDEEDEGAAALAAVGREQLRMAWSELETGLRDVLLPVLPWLPAAEQLQALREGLLDQGPAALQAASSSQLALMCTLCTQAGPQAGPQGWWVGVRAELEGRRLPPLSAEAPEAAEVGEGEAGGLSAWRGAGVGGKKEGPALFESAADLAAVCYGLEAAGCEVPEAAGRWLRRLLHQKAVLGAGGVDVRKRRGMVLPALQLLWTAHRFGCLAEVPDKVWATAYGSGGPWVTGLDRLQAWQLQQLVVIYAQRDRAGSLWKDVKGVSTPPPWFTLSWMAGLSAAYGRGHQEQEQEEQQQQQEEPPLQHQLLAGRRRQGGGRSPPSPSLVAAWAIAYCAPNAPNEQAASRWEPLVAAALRGLAEEVPLGDMVPLLRGLKRGGFVGSLPQLRLQQLMGRLLEGPAAGGSGEAEEARQGGAVVTAMSGLGGSGEGACASRLADLQAQGVLELLLAILAVCPLDADRTAALEPLFAVLVPYAEEELYGVAVPERLCRTVLAASMRQPPATADVVAEAASAAVVAAITGHQQASEKQHPPQPQQHLSQQRRKPKQQRISNQLDVSSSSNSCCTDPARVGSGLLSQLPATALAPLAAALIGSAGMRPVPRSAAAVLLRLLSMKPVVDQLSYSDIEQAVNHNLVDSGLPMCDATASALTSKLQVGRRRSSPAVDAVLWAEQLRRCGASAVLLQRALLGLRTTPLDELSGNEVLLLRKLLASGVREELAILERPRHTADALVAALEGLKGGGAGGGGPPTEGPVGQFAEVADLLLSSFGRTIRRRGAGLAEVTEAVQLACELIRRLDGLDCPQFYAHKVSLTDRWVQYLELPSLAAMVREDPQQLWRFLDGAYNLGEGRRLGGKWVKRKQRTDRVIRRHHAACEPEESMNE